MQTFLPYPDYEASAQSLDRARLGKQRVEVKQILRASLTGGGWSNHPAVLMWKGHERSLAEYGVVVCLVWRQRGYSDSLLPEFEEAVRALPDTGPPPWLGDDAFHRSHRSNLTRKDPSWYGTRWVEPDDLPYVWPRARVVETVLLADPEDTDE